jgi:hypothetical protein
MSTARTRHAARRVLPATALLTLLAGAAGPAGALAGSAAAAKAEVVRFSPAAPLSSQRFTARWRSVKARTRGRTYRAELRVTAPDGSLCTTERTLAIRRGWNAGDTLTFRLRPDDRTLGAESLWCPGRATFRVISTRPGTRAVTHVTKRVRIRADPANPVPKGVPLDAELLDGSLLTVQVPGRPDRTSTLSGRLSGFVRGAGDVGADVAFELNAGEVMIDGLAPDPLCTASGRDAGDRIEPASSGSKGRLARDGAFTMTLTIDEAPIGLTGCQGPAGPLQRRAIALSGRGPADGGLTRVEASGAVEGVAYADGTQARVRLTLVLAFDLAPEPA